ncbi:hypothetical protein GH714_028378 [Hevea brasiliensis]|uniref:EF-hand domain-containing protein n=1 Tax=Hevea brasiliensis TaxID=3981 RepID=A0A6A6LBN6_HEVBR|nr:hypothetical protein GH714_028378 [Hevea brasiliensis]
MKMVMDRLGIQQCDSDDDLQERYDARELSRLFEEHEPSLEEVKDAFDIFDENKDGFIDADPKVIREREASGLAMPSSPSRGRDRWLCFWAFEIPCWLNLVSMVLSEGSLAQTELLLRRTTIFYFQLMVQLQCSAGT